MSRARLHYLILPTGPLEQARRMIAAMHCKGVAQSDVLPVNMNFDIWTEWLFVYGSGLQLSNTAGNGKPTCPSLLPERRTCWPSRH